jgi:hypothetical protein
VLLDAAGHSASPSHKHDHPATSLQIAREGR